MILVTGGSGLVGSHLLLHLINSGEKVRALYRKTSRLSAVENVFRYYKKANEASRLFQKIDWVQADINDIPALEKAFTGITTVYHCAALVSFDPSNYKQLRKVNIEGTANVVNCCIKNKVQKLCYMGTIATFDEKLKQTVINESSTWNPEKNHNHYAITKYGAEIEVWRASQEGVPVVIVNPGVIIGPGFWNSGSGLIFKKINSGLKFYFPKITGFIGVVDVVKALKLLMEAPIYNEQYILVSENCSFKAIFFKIARTLNKPAPKIELKPWMVFLGWIGQKIFSPISGKERKLLRHSSKTLFSKTYYSSKKINEQLHLQFKPIDIVIAETAEFFRKDIKK